MKKTILLLSMSCLLMAGCSKDSWEDEHGGGASPNNPSGLPKPKSNEIYYTTTDGEKMFPNELDQQDFGAILISNEYKNGLGILTFNSTITFIGNNAFNDCTSLKSITIPNGVTEILGAFDGCTSLTSVTIPNSVTKIGYGAFERCTSLTSITIPNSVTEIGVSAFRESSLTSITIPNSVTEIGGYAFFNCFSLTSITIPNSVTKIKDSTFHWCPSLTSIIIPDSVTEIESYAFQDCTSLKSITIPNSVTEIGYGAFLGCTSLTSIIIPSSVTLIEFEAFYECTSLQKVYCKAVTPPDIDKIINEDWGAFDYNASTRKIYVPTKSVNAYKAAKGWSEYADDIVGYNFTE